MNKKRPRSKALADSELSNEEQKKATPTIATLGHARNLKLSFYMLASQPGRIYVSVTATGKSKAKGGGWSGDMELEADELTLPPSVLELVSIALDHAARPARKATKKAASPKSSYKITTKKATPPPARKAAVKRSKPNQKNLVPERKKTVASKTTKTVRRPAKASATATRRKPTRKGKRSR
jgi:hypothetical protein